MLMLKLEGFKPRRNERVTKDFELWLLFDFWYQGLKLTLIYTDNALVNLIKETNHEI
jgi:hypothetical protein